MLQFKHPFWVIERSSYSGGIDGLDARQRALIIEAAGWSVKAGERKGI